MEQLEVVCEETGRPLGVYCSRQEAIARGAWCRSTNIFVLNPAGEVLCHQRSLQKERMPGVWFTHLGGHVSKEETFESNALKELEEEAGIIVPATQLLPDPATYTPVPQPGEVDQFAWLSLDQILSEARRQPGKWWAGTHDFQVEYQCLQAVLTAAHGMQVFKAPA
jgi:isopentenyldiphosphate isomerase